MPFDYHSTLESISAKSRLLLERYRMVVQARDEALARVEQLSQQLTQQQKEIEKLRTDNEYLRMASTLAPSRDDVEKARDMITTLVREIDRCIIDLKE